MMTRSQTLDALIEQIRLAFRGVQRDGGISLHEAEAIDTYASEPERRAARAKDIDTSWEDVPAYAIEHNTAALSHLDPKGFRYYIPAYMVWALNNVALSNSLSIDATVYALLPSEGATQAPERCSLLTEAQGSAVLGFLEHMAWSANGRVDDSAARAAIEGYWKKFSSAG